MVDIAINGFASLSSDLSPASLASDDKGTLLFKQTDDYHPLCAVDFGNHTSEMDWYVGCGLTGFELISCSWLATSGVALMDINQSNQNVSNTLINWVNGYVNEYSIDGFRLDASKHMPIDFQHTFCSTAGVFCIGEVAGDDAT